MVINGSVINGSQTISAEASSKLELGPYTAVAFSGGVLSRCDDTLLPMGITITETDDEVQAGDDVHIQIKDISVWRTGGAFAMGDALASDATGRAVKATEGKFILGFALEESVGENQLAKVQITKSGKM